MKKLMTLMLALSFALGSVAISFADDTKSDTTSTKKAKKKKAPKKTTDTAAPKS